MKKPNTIIVITVGVVFFCAIFYWYEWRPSEIRKECNQIALSKQTENLTLLGKQAHYDYDFKACLNEKGL